MLPSMQPPVIDLFVESYYKVGLRAPILADVRWRVEPGQHWALVGENGSGKSSLLAIIAGDIWPSRGVVRVLGHEYGRVDKRELRKKIGVVSASMYARFPDFDLAVEVAASGVEATVGRLDAVLGEDAARARRALDRIGAGACADKRYGVLSQGERQRVMIARALINEPHLLILDEPCAGLDPVARERFLADLMTLARDPTGPTQIHVTHHLEEIPPFVSHALLLRAGRSIASGPVLDVLTSERLTEAFGHPCEVHAEADAKARRYRLRVL